jgi:ribosome assembly protein YihI (activator of Der GTPase)
MRAKEFTINVPITISISGDNDPVVSTSGEQPSGELQQNPVMVSPQQQELELAKAELGKKSPVIDKLTQDDSIGAEPEQQEDPMLSRIKQLMAR